MEAPDQAASTVFAASHRHAVRATSIIGGAATVNIAFGVLRMKIAAIILGPVGIGMIGLLQNLLNTAATLAGLNLGVAGARQIVASSNESKLAAAAARRAVLLTATLMALASGLAFWLFRVPLAGLLFQDRARSQEVGWLAIGVAATAGAGYQTAILSASRRIGDIARLSLLTAATAGIVGSICIVVWKSNGILPFILATPIAALGLGWLFVRRASANSEPVNLRTIRPHIAGLIKLGAALTAAIFVSLCGQLTIRTLVERKLGATALGHFQAAWTITTVYLAFIYQTMANDYLPRLTAAIEDRAHCQSMVQTQARVGMLLGAPILLAMIGGAPWGLSILYSSQFIEATTLLRCQMAGDLVRLAVWPVALVLVAAGASREYALADITGTAVLVAGTVLLLPVLGLSAPGLAYVITNIVFGAIVMFIVHRRYSIALGGSAIRMFACLVASCALTYLISLKFPMAGAFAGALAASLWIAYGYFSLYQRRPAE
jgi:O-antigen/teichoic acid export membrane protein